VQTSWCGAPREVCSVNLTQRSDRLEKSASRKPAVIAAVIWCSLPGLYLTVQATSSVKRVLSVGGRKYRIQIRKQTHSFLEPLAGSDPQGADKSAHRPSLITRNHGDTTRHSINTFRWAGTRQMPTGHTGIENAQSYHRSHTGITRCQGPPP